jgi:hypothetical protein
MRSRTSLSLTTFRSSPAPSPRTDSTDMEARHARSPRLARTAWTGQLMARIRTIKPDFWEDELVAALSRDARLLFIATWNLADDEGRLRWAAPYIKSKVFPYDDDLDSPAVAELMGELERTGRVRAYMVDSGTIMQAFAFVVNFPRHQRINRAQDSSLPAPPPDEPPPGDRATSFTERSVNPHGSTNDPAVRDHVHSSAGSTLEGKGKEGKGRERKTAPPAAPAEPDTFPGFWSVYPRKVDKRIAERAYRTALKRGATPEQIIAAARAYAESQRNTELRFVKHPSSWLNAGAYENEPEPLRLVSGGSNGYRAFTNPVNSSVYDEPLLDPNPEGWK